MSKKKKTTSFGLGHEIWYPLKRKLQNVALGVIGRPIRIYDIPETDGALGYTLQGNRIYVAPVHPIMKGLSEAECTMFVKGVFVHEMMHQVATDFKTYIKVLDKLPEDQRPILQTLFNVMEDPAIEYQAPRYLGGHLLRALRYTVMHCYREAPELDEKTAFQELVSALIQYGDGGYLKGSFSFPEARACFCKLVPIYDRAIAEPDPTRRVHYALDAFELSRPLWEKDLEDAEAMRSMLDELMRECGKSMMGSGDGPDSDNPQPNDADGTDSSRSESAKEKRRKVTFKEISKEEMEELKKNAAGSGSLDDGDGDLIVLYTRDAADGPDPKEGDEKAHAPSNDDTGTETTREGDLTSDGESTPAKGESAENKEKNAENGRSESSDANADASHAPPTESGKPMRNGGEVSDDGCIDEEEYELSPADAEKIEAELRDLRHVVESESRAAAESGAEDLDIPDMKALYPTASYLHRRVTLKGGAEYYEETYDAIVEPMQGEITLLTNQLKRIFQNDVAEREYRGSGRVSIKRLNDGRMSTRVFERKRLPSNRSNLCVELLIDESGSMHGSRIDCARKCAIGLAEVFGRLNVPLKVIGFTADVDANRRRYDVVHDHYLNWLNTKAERMKLLNIHAQDDNFDGYSIHYAGKSIAKHRAEHKLLIIVSDGQPACFYYRSAEQGIADTKAAIRDAAKKADVIGVAIGQSDTELLYSMYGEHFLHVKDVKEMFHAIGKKIQGRVRSW